ncbi:MAG: CoB--CoM heterodisulfide reductase iron-sulfur subunit B family protein [Deltaproteobacteria bacterium]|nr:CoB--CoM heterodisulfide reductase iron-sulfur subunit B family protein [Candidatus Tharpellaceae bacterium]
MGETYSYYPGCTSHSTAVEYIEASLAVIEALGIELQELPDWCCCGAASAHNFSTTLALGLSAFNLAEAHKVGVDLVIPCAGCYGNLAQVDYVMRHDEKECQRFEKQLDFNYDGQVKMLSLVDLLAREELRPAIKELVKKPLTGLKVVCYYGCAIVRPAAITGVDDSENPQRLDKIMADLGAEVIDWSCKVDCCGADLGLTDPEKTTELVNKIVDYAVAAGADCLVTSCALCEANIDIRQQRLPILFFTEMMAEAFQIGNRQRWWKKHFNNPANLF